jgi:uncharacterized membrane protein
MSEGSTSAPAPAPAPTLARRRDGFRERGGQVTRVEAFIDAAFAFAVTLIVISIDAIPNSTAEMRGALLSAPAFAASFALIALFWHAHHTWSRRFGLDDMPSVLLGLLLVFLVLLWVYPLRAMFGAAFGWITQMALPEGWQIGFDFVVRGYGELAELFVIYAIAWSSLGFVIAALYAHAWRRRDALALDDHERARTRGEIARWLWVPATGVASIAVALLLPGTPPPWAWGAPGLVYFLMFFSDPIAAWAERSAGARPG